MKRYYGLFIIVLTAMLLAGCDVDTLPSLFDPNATGNPSPAITDVQPAGSVYAVIQNVTISGENFSPVPEENTVFFSTLKGVVLSATSSQLVVAPPYVTGTGIELRVSVFGAELYSNSVLYEIRDPAPELYEFDKLEKPYAIAADADGNVYTSVTLSGSGVGTKKITPEGILSDYAPKGAETFWSSVKVGPGDELYVVRQVRALFKIPAGGGASATWAVLSDFSAKLADIDFDADLNLWCVGNNTKIYMVKPDKTVVEHDFEADLKSVRIFDGYVYVAGTQDGAAKIWRFEIQAGDQIGAEEVHFDFSAAYAGYTPLAITFDAEGELYVGTDAPASIVVVHADKTHDPLYPGLLSAAPTISMAWDNDTGLYITREAKGEEIPQTILHLEMFEEGAPYYGRGDL